MLLCSATAFATESQPKAPSKDMRYPRVAQPQETANGSLEGLRCRIDRLEEDQKNINQRLGEFHNSEESKRENIPSESKEHEKAAEARIDQMMPVFNTWVGIIGLILSTMLLIIAAFGIIGWRKAEDLLDQQKEMLKKSHKILTKMRQNVDKSDIMFNKAKHNFAAFFEKSIPIIESEQPQPVDPDRVDSATITANLVLRYIDSGNLDKALETYNGMSNNLSDPEALKELRAKAAANLTRAYCKAGNISQALDIYNRMSKENLDSLKEPLAIASTSLSFAYANDKKLDEAQDIYNNMPSSEGSENIKMLRAMAAANLILEYGYAGELSTAQKIYNNMPGLGEDTEDVKTMRAMAAKHLILGYVKVGRFGTAQGVYRTMYKLGPSEAVKKQCDEAAQLISRFRHGSSGQGK